MSSVLEARTARMGVCAIKTLFTTLRKHRIPYAGFALFYIAASLVISASFIIVQILAGEMGQAAHELDTGTLTSFLLLLTGAMGARAIFSALSVLLLGRFSGSAGYNFRVNFAKFFLRQPFAKLEKTNSGENLSVFTNDLPQAVQLVSSGVLAMVADFMLLIVVLVYMFYMNWLYTLIYIATFPVIALVQVAISAPLQKDARREMETRAAFNAVVNDSLQNIATVIAYNLEGELEARYVAAYKTYFDAGMRRMRLISTTMIAGMMTATLPMVYLLIASGFAVVNGTMDIADFIAFTGIGMMAANWLMGLSQSLGRVRTWLAGAERLNEATTGEAENVGEAQPLASGGGAAVAFENVGFSYAEDGAEVLRDVSFAIPQGAKVAIVGESGSGKSTILKLLLGLYEPKNGKISVLGTDAASIGKYTLREAFAYVPQDSFLFPVSIGENITGKTVLTPSEQAKLEKVCRDAGILDFINSLPDKFASTLFESAENISGGQRQRIAMARAFYKDAPIILFDEATSALDPATEAEILKSLAAATENKTVIMVAHRAAAQAFCDTVITMKGGGIA